VQQVSASLASMTSNDEECLAGFEDVILLLWNGRDHEALSIVETWPCWPTDADLVIVMEAYYRCKRPECVPILRRMLAVPGIHEQDREQLVGMIERARAWG
jgi:hypothetical protein